ncbi:MAG: glycosyltransferase [Opitutales bacterium]
MRICFIDQADSPVSGVTTYGRWLHRTLPGVQVLQLGSEGPDFAERGRRLPATETHRPEGIAAFLRDWIGNDCEQDWLLLPNCGQTAHEACRLLLLDPPKDRELRVLGYAHSDDANTGLLLEHYQEIFSGVVAVSDHLQRRLKGLLNGTAGVRLHCLPYPQAPLAVASETNREPDQPLRLIYAGRLEETQKRLSRLVDVLEFLDEAGMPFQLDLLGAGPAETPLRNQLSRWTQGTHPSVRFLGACPPDAVPAHLARADVLLLTSAYEGNPLVLAEGMAARLCPVVMAIDSGVGELIRHGESGFLTPQGDVAAMARVLEHLHRDRELLEGVKDRARSVALAERCPERHREAFETFAEACFTWPQPTGLAPELPSPQETALRRLLSGPSCNRLESPTVIFGAGVFGRSLADRCRETGVRVEGFVDSDPRQQGNTIDGLPVQGPESLLTDTPRCILLGSMGFCADMRSQIQRLYRSHAQELPRIVGLDRV